MGARFDACLVEVLKHEGGYVDHPRDPGGATNMGISLRYARTQGRIMDYNEDGVVDKQDILLVTPERAAIVYKNWFWRDVRGEELPGGVDLAVFDYAVNSGPGRAIKSLQRALGIQEDGVFGPATLEAVKKADPAAVINAVCRQRMSFLRGLHNWGTFGRGWTDRVNSVHLVSLDMIGTPQMTMVEAATQTNTVPSGAIIAGVGAAATAAQGLEPVVRLLGSMAPWVAIALIAATLLGVWLWRSKRL